MKTSNKMITLLLTAVFTFSVSAQEKQAEPPADIQEQCKTAVQKQTTPAFEKIIQYLKSNKKGDSTYRKILSDMIRNGNTPQQATLLKIAYLPRQFESNAIFICTSLNGDMDGVIELLKKTDEQKEFAKRMAEIPEFQNGLSVNNHIKLVIRKLSEFPAVFDAYIANNHVEKFKLQ